MHYMDKRFQEKIPGTPAYYEKRKREQQNQEITRINQELQRVIQSVSSRELKEEEVFKKALREANRSVVSSSILSLMYRNNFENEQVAYSSIVFILSIIPLLKDEKREQVLRNLQTPKRMFLRVIPEKTREIESLERQLKK